MTMKNKLEFKNKYLPNVVGKFAYDSNQYPNNLHKYIFYLV